ncbi:MAG: hypothetical protein KDK25_07960, partial [Leptospiraceae bacterium]|nr:hypothetical protein [Leptospiraceae bacterium]
MPELRHRYQNYAIVTGMHQLKTIVRKTFAHGKPLIPAVILALALNATCDSSVQELPEDRGIRFLVDE